jgi:large subunit ribosomal protein L32
MANPKRRWSKARTGKRRSQWKLAIPGMVQCPQCHEMKLPHRVCKLCGFYDGKEIIKVESK